MDEILSMKITLPFIRPFTSKFAGTVVCPAVCIASLLLASCSSSYRVLLNNNEVYNPYGTTTTPSLLNDPNLQGCLNQAYISTGSNNPEDITLLACPSAGVQSLAGIRGLPNLEQIELSDNAVSDLSPLLGLRNLRVLSIRNNRISNVNALMSLPIIRFVALQGNNEISCRQLDQLQEKIGNSLNRPESCSN